MGVFFFFLGFGSQCARCNMEVKDLAQIEASIASIKKSQQDIQRCVSPEVAWQSISHMLIVGQVFKNIVFLKLLVSWIIYQDYLVLYPDLRFLSPSVVCSEI